VAPPVARHRLITVSTVTEAPPRGDGVGAADHDVVVPRTVAPLVGRRAELATLVGVLDSAAAGAAGVAVVGGDAGVGKTRLLGELVDTATERGSTVLLGHCVDLGDTPPPYLPFTEAFARLAAVDGERVDALIAAHPPIAGLVPGRTPGRGIGPADERLDRGVLFEAVLAALADLAQYAPVLLVVEDAHWADQATRDLLGFLFTRVRAEQLAVVASFRSDDLHRRHPLRRTLAEWSRLPAVTRVQLDRLTADDVRELIRSLHAGALTAPEIDSIVDRADGNAFFAEELVTATEQCGTASHLPWQLADLLLVRLERLTDDAREVVRVAAVAGRRVDHAMLVEVANLPADRLDPALRDAIDAHVLQLTPSGRGYTFRHALLAEAVYDDLLPGEIVRLHAAYALALATRQIHSSAELARHARASHDLDTAYLASVRAGDEAMTLAAPQEALQHFETALELAPRADTAPADLSDLVVATVEAADAAGHSARGLRLARAALAALPVDAPDLQRARLLYALVRAALGEEIDEDVLAASSTALSLVPAEPPTTLRVRVLAQHASVAFLAGRDVEAYRSAHEAIELGERIGERIGVADARTSLAVVARRAEEPDAVLAGLREAENQARRAGDARSEVRSSYSRGGLFLELGDLERAQEAFDKTVTRARETGRLWDVFGLNARTSTGVVRYARGDWDGALRVLDLGDERPPELARALTLATAALVHAGRGERDVLDAVDQLRPIWEREGRIGLHCWLAALEIYEQDGNHQAGLELSDEMRTLLGRIWNDEWPLVLIQTSAKVLAALTTAAVAAPQRERAVLGARAGQLLSDGRTAAEKGLPVGRELGIEGRAWLARLEAEAARLRWVSGVEAPDPDRHIELWQRAAAAFDYGNEVELARTRARLAAVLRAAGRSDEATEAARSARTAARAMRAEPLLRELSGLGASAPATSDPSSGGLAALTDRERDVLALLVEARTNRQIANRLYISEKTVSVHVSNILAKLGVRSRAEAAALARRD
jgi:DNA-binding NarL/FixJ family response regulator